MYTNEKLEEIKSKYDAIFLTIEIDQVFPTDGIVFTGGMAYSNDKKSYEVVDAVADGRRAAMQIHQTLE
jgi:hypothetical protein